MKILTLLSLALLLLSSCRSVNKSLSKNKQEEVTKTDNISASTSTAATNATTAATRTIIEENDSNQVVHGSILTASGSAAELSNGGTIHGESNDQEVEVTEDPETGEIKIKSIVKDRKIPVHEKKTTIENESTVSTNTSGTTSNQEIQTETDKKSKSVDSTVTKKSGANLVLIGFVSCLLLIVIIIFGWRYFKRSG